MCCLSWEREGQNTLLQNTLLQNTLQWRGPRPWWASLLFPCVPRVCLVPPCLTCAALPVAPCSDVSSNFLTGGIPLGFLSTPLRLNLSNNYFTGDPTVTYTQTVALTASGAPYKMEQAVFCPADGVSWIGSNCLTLSVNQPCPGQAQRSPAACAAFCGIVAIPTNAGLTSTACGDGVGGTCVPQAPISTVTNTAGKCSGKPTHCHTALWYSSSSRCGCRAQRAACGSC